MIISDGQSALDFVASMVYGHDCYGIAVNAKTFADNFSVTGETLKKVPQGYNADHPQAEYFKNKSWYLEYSLADELVMDTSGFIDYAAQLFQYMKPLNDYLNAALKGFIMPAR